jgi:curved DNA-binding protein CbpA
MNADRFVDYYELLQISPNSEPETIRRVFRLLAARFHPDNPETGNAELFVRLVKAYRTLIDPEQRRVYDEMCKARRFEALGFFGLKEFAVGIEGENNRRLGVLCLLYQKRRTDIEKPSYSLLELERLMSFPREHLLFTLWYLKEKGLVRQDENSDYAITAEGVDTVEQKLPSHEILFKLLKAAEEGVAREQAPWAWRPEVEPESEEWDRLFGKGNGGKQCP